MNNGWTMAWRGVLEGKLDGEEIWMVDVQRPMAGIGVGMKSVWSMGREGGGRE